MMINNGDKLVVKKTVAEFLKEGDIVEVVNSGDGIIQFAFGENFMHMGVMTTDECENHFDKYVEKVAAPTVTTEHIRDIINNSDIEAFTIFDKCTVVACKLPNGFVIVESSACVSPENYDEEIGFEICFGKIVDKVWELEGYKLQNEVYEAEMHEANEDNMAAHTCDCCDCKNEKNNTEEDGSSIYGEILAKLFNDIEKFFPVNSFNNKDEVENENKDFEDEDFDECLDTDLDCYDCVNYECFWNPDRYKNIT